MTVVEVKCRNGHRCIVLPGQIAPTSFPMCEQERCYKPLFPVEARERRASDTVYRQGRPS